MTRRRCALVFAVFAGCLLIASTWFADSSAISITFSKDEQTVTIRRGGRVWELARPVVVPWKYQTDGQLYWVAPDGTDEGFGSEDKPFRTIQKALSRTVAGDIVYVRAGQYVENLVLTHSGEEGKPIILSCAPGALGKVKITPSPEYVRQNRSGAVLTVRGASHVWINGLVIEGPKGRPEAPKIDTYGANGVTWDKTGPGCRATNNIVYGNVHCGLKQMNYTDTAIRAEGNIIFDNGTESRDHGIYLNTDEAVADGNVIFENAGFGIHSYPEPKRQVLIRNVCFANKEGGIVLGGSANKVYHNVCANNLRGIFYFRMGCKQNDVRNNVFAFNRIDCAYDNGGGKLGDPSANTDDYNCYYPGKPDAKIQPGSHEVLADPHFQDTKKGDFRLSSSSPCRGQGTRVKSTTQEKPDLGAFVREKP
jgi:hypothetical protein